MRHPVQIVATPARLFVANRRSGSVSVIDRRTRRLVGETKLAQSLADIAHIESNYFLMLDDHQHELLAVEYRKDGFIVRQRTPVPVAPVTLNYHRENRTATVTSLWGRAVSLFDVAGNGQVTPSGEIPLPFPPRMQYRLHEHDVLVVADAFGGRLGWIDLAKRKLQSIHALQASNIRGLTVSPDGQDLLITQQMANETVPIERNRVFWGTVMSNVIRGVPLRDLLAPPAAPRVERDGVPHYTIGHWKLYPLGESGRAAGDPGELQVTRGGTWIVALSGVNEFAWRKSEFVPFVRLPTGRRPTAVVLSDDERECFIANTLDDSITLVNLAHPENTTLVSLGPRPELSLADRGEQLFYNSKVTLDGWFSCHSCHTDGHTTGSLSDNFGDTSYGAPKRIPSLLGVRDTGPWGWLGNHDSLTDQIQLSMKKTMHAKPEQASMDNAVAIAAFLRTLPLPPPREPGLTAQDRSDIRAGRKLFERLECNRCHRGNAFTNEIAANVGLEDDAGNYRFNPPSLRGVGQRDRLFHDGSASSLEEVVIDYGHFYHESLSPAQLRLLLKYLRSL